MATKISAASSNFTTGSTWKDVSSVANAEVDSEAGTLNLSTGNSDSTAFTLAAAQVDAVAIKLSAIVTPTGTLTVKLRNSTSGTDVATVTINASDLHANAKGWHVFSFAGHTPNGTDSYLVRVTRSVADGAGNRITVYATSSTAATMCRAVRLTSTGAPAAGDKLILAGEFTGAGASTSYTVTMNETATTSYGPTVSGGPPQGITINNKATLTYGTSAATAYYLKYKGVLAIFGGGTLNMGTTGTPMPSGSSAVLEMDSVANVDTGLQVQAGGTFNAQGNALSFWKTLLAANASAAATALTTADSTGWVSGDEIAMASTTRTASECEKKTTSSSSGTTLNVAAITNARSGTSPTQAELVNLTRNVKIRGISTSLQGFVDVQNGATVDWDWVEFYQLGSSTIGKRGVDVAVGSSGSFDAKYCSFHDFVSASSFGVNFTSATGANSTLQHCGFYNIAGTFVSLAATTATTITLDDLIGILTASSTGFSFGDAGSTITNIVCAGATTGITISESGGTIGTISGLTSHSNSSTGITLSGLVNGTISGTNSSWRNNSTGLSFAGGMSGVIVDNFSCFGNLTTNVGQALTGVVTVRNGVISSDTTFTVNNGYNASAGSGTIIFENTTFGVASGIKSAHTRDILANTGSAPNVILRNCLLASGTELASQSTMPPQTYIASEKHDQTAGSHKCWKREGTLSIDTTIYSTASPSLRMTPLSATEKLDSLGIKGGWFVPVASGATVTPSVKVRESVVGDGTDYNGSRIRLRVRANPALGINADATLATATVASEGAFETISGTTATVSDDGVLEFYVDADGTLGWANADDFSA